MEAMQVGKQGVNLKSTSGTVCRQSRRNLYEMAEGSSLIEVCLGFCQVDFRALYRFDLIAMRNTYRATDFFVALSKGEIGGARTGAITRGVCKQLTPSH